jgi:ankyrin repeat protein
MSTPGSLSSQLFSANWNHSLQVINFLWHHTKSLIVCHWYFCSCMPTRQKILELLRVHRFCDSSVYKAYPLLTIILKNYRNLMHARMKYFVTVISRGRLLWMSAMPKELIKIIHVLTDSSKHLNTSINFLSYKMKANWSSIVQCQDSWNLWEDLM